MTRASSTRPDPSRFAVVYECPECDERFLDQRRCPDCQLFCRRIDLGGSCPICAEPVAISDLAHPADGMEVASIRT